MNQTNPALYTHMAYSPSIATSIAVSTASLQVGSMAIQEARQGL